MRFHGIRVACSADSYVVDALYAGSRGRVVRDPGSRRKGKSLRGVLADLMASLLAKGVVTE